MPWLIEARVAAEEPVETTGAEAPPPLTVLVLSLCV